MSITSYREPMGYRPELAKRRGAEGRAAESLFTDAIQRDPSLCNSCFSERFDWVSLEWKCGEQGWLPYRRRFPIAGQNEPDPRRDLRHDGGPLACANCGMVSGTERPLSHRQATAHAARISSALTRRGIDHDRKTLLAVTVDKISEPDSTGVEDAQVFPAAVAESVRAVQ